MSDEESVTLPVRKGAGLAIAIVVGLLAAGVAVFAFAGGGDSTAAVDAGVDAHRPMVIGMPVFIERSTVVPVDEETLARVVAEDRAAMTEQPRTTRRTAAARPTRSSSASVEPRAEATTGGTRDEAPTTSTTTMGGGRTIAASDGPAAQAAAAAYRIESQRVIQQRYLSQVQDCFDRATRADPSLSGQVTLGLIAADDGHVMGSRAVRDTIGAGVGACVAGAARSWQLPPPPPNALEMHMTFAL
ncbi:MAG: AgmX/PglI C-terminal domain-containing protein [Deltaproteobacteria bacterium]|nr:AgmX/PglI C-terminal domain-containing protein [Deltaproteobacteria bacterium]